MAAAEAVVVGWGNLTELPLFSAADAGLNMLKNCSIDDSPKTTAGSGEALFDDTVGES